MADTASACWRRLVPADPLWPVGWADLAQPPDQAFVVGDATALNSACIGIVGTRRATPRGLAVARGLARDLSALGWTVVSGLAYGVDGEAHRGALDAGARTIAVMATGPDRTYPREHQRLRRRIEAAGCTVTEADPAVPPRRFLFPRRNRLIAAMCRAVVVVEAPARSGALITAELAADLGRDVFAVPGPVDRWESRGCHRLLRQGACLLETVRDVIEVVGHPGPAREPADTTPRQPVAGSAARWILDRLDLEGVDHGELLERWPGNREMWTEGLLALELAGLIRRLPGGRLARRIWRS